MSDDKAVKKELTKRQAQDLNDIIKLVLSSPIKNAPVARADGEIAVKDLAEQNTDVQTRMVLQIAFDASKGDVKAAEFLAKYGGFEPASKQEIQLDVPQLIDDMTCRATPVVCGKIEEIGEDEDTI